MRLPTDLYVLREKHLREKHGWYLVEGEDETRCAGCNQPWPCEIADFLDAYESQSTLLAEALEVLAYHYDVEGRYHEAGVYARNCRICKLCERIEAAAMGVRG